MELETEKKVKEARSDNAPELIKAVHDWRARVKHQLTTIASSHQNGKAERNIQIAEANIRSITKQAGLPIEFWDHAGIYDVCVRNRTGTGPIIDGIQVSLEEVYTGITPQIDHIKIWGLL